MKTKSPAVFVALALLAGLALFFTIQRNGHDLRSDPNRVSARPDQPWILPLSKPQAPLIQTYVHDPRTTPSWAVAFGKEFWKPERTGPMKTEQQILASGLIDRMKLRFQQDGGSGLPVVHAKTYTLEMDAAGFRYTPGGFGETFHIATQKVEMPGLPAQGEIGGWSVVGNTAQRDRFGNQSVIEHVEAGPQGASITWVIPKAPTAAEDSIIHVAVSGGATVATNGQIKVGNKAVASWGGAVAVDATGLRTPLPTHFEGDQITIELSANLLATSHYPLAIDPTISPLTALDPDETVRPTGIDPIKVVGTGTSWLVLTEDGDLVFVDTAGEAIVPQILSSTDVFIEDIAFTSGKYLAFGVSDSDTTRLGGIIFEVTGGAISSISDFVLFTASVGDFPAYIAVETSSDRTLVTWTTRSDETGEQTEGILGVILGSDGIPIAAPFGISGYDDNLTRQSVSAMAGSSAQTWLALVQSVDGSGSTYGAHHITTAGAGLETVIPSTTVAEIAWGGTANWLVTWPETGGTTRGQRFQADGTVNGAEFEVYNGVGSFGLVGQPNGWAQLFAENDNDLVVRTIAANATTATVATGVNGVYVPEAASSNEDLSAALFILRYTVNGRFTDRSLIINPATGAFVSGPTVLIEKSNDQSNLSVVGNGTTILAAWIDDADPDYTSVVGVRLDNTGAVLDSNPIDFSASAPDEEQGAVEVAVVDIPLEGTTFLVAFTEFDEFGDELALGRLCSDAGVVSGTEPFEIGTGELGMDLERIAAQASSTNFLVAWVGFNDDFNDEVQGVVVSTGGAVGTKGVFAPGASNKFYYEVALGSNGTDWMVGYVSEQATFSSLVSRYSARRIVSPGTVAGSEITISSAYAESIDLAFSGTQYLAVWNDEDTADLYGRRFTATGTLSTRVVLDDFAFDGNVLSQDSGWLVGFSGFDDDVYAPRVIRVNANGVPERLPATVELVEGDALLADNGSGAGAFVGVTEFDLVGQRVFGATAEYAEPLVTNASSAVGRAGSFFAFALTSTNATSYSLAGTLPPGLSLASATGVISGRPTVAGTYPLTILATNGSGTGQMSFSITILRAVTPPDRTPPTINAKNVVTKKDTAKVRVTTNDAVRLRYRVKPPGGKFSKFKTKSISGSTRLTLRTRDVGTYRVQIKAFDAAGNTSTKTVRVKRKE